MFDQFLEGSSYWTETTPLPEFPALDRAPDVDVIIVGGGMTGITAAHLLKQAGKRVALLDRGRCATGQTARTTAHLTAVVDTPLARLVERLGVDDARHLWDAGFAAISRIRAEVRDLRIHCDFAWVRGCLHAPLEQDLATARLSLNHEASIATALGINATYVDQVPGIGRPGVCFEGQARLHPLRFLSVLLERIDGDGSHVFEHTRVDEIDPDTMTVVANGVRLSAPNIVLATHTPLPMPVMSAVEDAPFVDAATSYVVSGTAPHGVLPEGVYWEHRDAPYDYLRLDRHEHHDLVIFGGLDHPGPETAAAADRFSRLERRLAQRIPGVRVERRWSGRVTQTADGLPYIGELANGLFIATGFGGNGMTFATLAGMMAADGVRGVRAPWSHLFSPRRTRVITGPWSGALAAS